MKKVFLLMMCMTSFASASTLSEGIETLKNRVDTRVVSAAVVCAETNLHCENGQVVGGKELEVLKEAELASEVYGQADLERISNAIKILQPIVDANIEKLQKTVGLPAAPAF